MTPAAPAMTWFWPVWLAAIVFVFPIPHTIALRNGLLLIGLLALIIVRRSATRPMAPRSLKPAAWALVATTAWLVLHSIAVAPAPTFALDNLRGDWFVPLLTGALSAAIAARTGTRRAIAAVVGALLAHMLWMFGWQLWLFLANATPAPGFSALVPFAERDYHSSLNGFLLAILLAERVATYVGGRSAAMFSSGLGWPALAVSLIADVALRTRNGTVITALLLLAGIGLAARRKPRLAFLILVVAALGGASLTLDSRWSGLKESLAVGWNSPSLCWMNSDPAQRPPTASGAPLDESAYARAAWAHQAAEAIAALPLGLGFGRDAFGRAIEDRYGFKGMVSSHSGWLDFALGTGLPGLALLVLAAGLAIRGGWQQFRRHEDPVGLMLCFISGGYLLRCLLDGHLSGWRLGLFAFICGVLIGSMRERPSER